MDFPEDVVVHILSFIYEQDEIIPCLATCKSWISIVKHSSRLQRHLFYVFWGVPFATLTSDHDSIYNRQLEMKRNFNRALKSTRAHLQWQAPSRVSSGLRLRLSGLATRDLHTGSRLVYFLQSLEVALNTSTNAESKSALHLQCIDPISRSLKSFRDVVSELYPQADCDFRLSGAEISSDAKSPFALSDSSGIEQLRSDYICWQYRERAYVLHLPTLSLESWPLPAEALSLSPPGTSMVAHSSGFFELNQDKLRRVDFGGTFTERWTVPVRSDFAMLTYSAFSSLLVLSNHINAREKDEFIVCVVDCETGKLSEQLSCRRLQQFRWDHKATFHFTAHRRGLLVSTDAVRLLQFSPDLKQLSILDTFVFSGHAIRASSYALNVLLVEHTEHFGMRLVGKTNVSILRISTTKIEGDPRRSLEISTPRALCLDDNFNIYTCSILPQYRYEMYRLGE